MTRPFLLTNPILPIRPIRAARMSVLMVLGLFAARWIAGIVEHLGLTGLSELASLAMLAGLAFLFLVHLRWAAHSTLLLGGILALLFAAQLSYAANPMPNPGEAHALMALLCLYALAAHGFFLHLRTAHALEALRWFFLCFLLVGGVLTATQVQSGFGFIDPARAHLIRGVGSDVHPVSYALQLVMAGTGLIVVNLKLGRSWGLLCSVSLALGALALYLTFARTAWVMAGVIMFLALWTRGGITTKIIGSLTIGLAALAFAQSDRFEDLGSLPFFLSNFDWHNIVFDHRYIDNSVSWRIVNWGFGITQALENPWLGVGPGQSALASLFGREMHNIVLEIFLEMGAIGLAALTMIFAGLIRLHRGLSREGDVARKARALINAAGFALAMAALFSTSLIDQLMSILTYFLVLAAGFAPDAVPRDRKD